MTRDWKTSEEITESDQIHDSWTDLILNDKFSVTKEDWDTVIAETVKYIRGWNEKDIKGRVSCLVDLLLPPLETLWQGKTGEPSFRWFRWLPCKSLQGATVADHALTASAIAYCLAYDLEPRPDIETLDKLRLSALAATWKDDGLGDVYDALWGEDSPIEPNKDGSEHEQIVFLAKVAASERKEVEDVQFNDHPLNQNKQIGLVLGGATKIKGYFLESAKLPEIRGASALLDRINLEDVPALFGRKIQDEKRFQRIREGFKQRTGDKLSAPECIIYAAGGNTLAFAPTSVVHQIADEIERIYTHETLVANSVAVGDTFDLLEVQYGLNPTQFWMGDFQKACEKPETKEIMCTYYGSTNDDFLKRKCFGELTSKLAGAQLKRREGNPTPDRKTKRDLPTHVEIGPYQTRCESCERRPTVINTPKVLCEACTRKYVTGRATKKQPKRDELDHYTNPIKWLPANKDENGEYLLTDWISLYYEYIKLSTGVSKNYDQDPDGPNDLSDIAKASHPENYIAFIYADGNNMGAYLENIETPAQYRQFSERVFVAMQTAAFKALAKLEPVWIRDDDDRYVFPFEIISIGGDDLLIIVPGSEVFEIVHAIGENFDSEFNSYDSYARLKEKDNLPKSQRYKSSEWVEAQEMQPVFSMSLGFVIAEGHTPVAFLEHLAGSLLKSAKTRAKTLIKDAGGYSGGTVDFLVLKSISMITSNHSDFRKKFYKTNTKNSLTMRPFTFHELLGFIKTIKDFKKGNFSRSQLYQLRQSLKLGRSTSTLDYLYFRSRLGSGEGKLLQDQIEHNWHGTSEKNNNPGPWYAMLQESDKDKKGYETLLFDLIEAYDFIPDPEEQNKEDNSGE